MNTTRTYYKVAVQVPSGMWIDWWQAYPDQAGAVAVATERGAVLGRTTKIIEVQETDLEIFKITKTDEGNDEN